jgi:predicted site-specific integrase-resolvase
MDDLIKKIEMLKEKEYLTIKETTGILGIHENTLYNIFKTGKLKPVKFMRKNYLKSKDILEWAETKFGEDVVRRWMYGDI